MPQAEWLRSGGSSDRATYESFYLDTANIWIMPAGENGDKLDDVFNAKWQPREGTGCRFAARWISTKKKWNLTIDPAEKTKLEVLLATC